MPDAVAIAEDNYFTAFRLLAEAARRGVVAEQREVLHVSSGAGIPTFNPTILKRLGPDVDVVIDDAVRFHAEAASPGWAVAVRSTDAPRFSDPAKRRGFTLAGEVPFMVLDAVDAAALPERLSVRRVEDVSAMRRHFDVAARSFGFPLDVVEPILSDALIKPPFAWFIGEVGGEAVATSMVCPSEGAGVPCAGIYNVATLDTHRRQGLGAAMTAWAAAVARAEHGCAVATLQASPMGQPVYERMGYRPVGWWQHWLPPAG